MIKAISKTYRGLLVTLGLSEKNVEMLKQDKPITFDLSEMGVPPYPVCISYKHDDGNACLPSGFSGRLFAFDEAELAEMRSTPRRFFADCHWLIYVGKDEATMAEQHREFIEPNTTVQQTGYAPSDKIVNPN